MSEFKRGIDNKYFIEALNKNIYFQKMRGDKDLFIAIRNEYLNVYYFGQSICKIEFRKRKKMIKWTTHKKYIDICEKGYTEIGDDHLCDIDNLKKNAYEHKGQEKEQVKKNILENNEICVLDVEITFGREQGFGTRSIDYLTVERVVDSGIILVFYEAKHSKNNEIRAQNELEPKIFQQIEKYEKVLNDPNHKTELLNSYKKIYENIIQLNLNNKYSLDKLIGLNFENVKINTEPKIIIFEIEHKINDNKHIEKLRQKYTENRLILIDKK